MKNYIIFRLYGSMVSWGDLAVGETRNTFRYPTKTAILGLVGAALGIKRDQEEQIKLLKDSIGFAVRIDHVGQLVTDYHTTQVASDSAMRKNKYANITRKNQLSLPKLNTILSAREYYCDGLYTIVLWQRNSTKFILADIQVRLKNPIFAPYLGRKAFPLGLPIKIFNIYSSDIEEALKEADKEISLIENGIFLPLIKRNIIKKLYWEDDECLGIKENDKIIKRKDNLLNRARWQFQDRVEYCRILEDNIKDDVF